MTYRLLVSKIKRHGEDAYKVKLIETESGKRLVLEQNNSILNAEQLKQLELTLANQAKLVVAEYPKCGRRFKSKNFFIE